MGKLIDRINELSRKAKSQGLSSEELSEQAALREQYLNNFRSNMRQQLEQIRWVEGEQEEPNKQVH